MEKPLKCVLQLSLKEIVLRRVVSHLWSNLNVVVSISKVLKLLLPNGKKWETVEDEIKNKVLRIVLPETLTKELIDIVEPIGREIRNFENVYQRCIFRSESEKISLPDSAKLCFTTAGALDHRRTAEELVRCEKIKAVHRYQIACLFWLEDYIPHVWEELPKDWEKFFYNANVKSLSAENYWPIILRVEKSKRENLRTSLNEYQPSVNQWSFEHYARERNKEGMEYFYPKLTEEERETSMLRSAYAVLRHSDMAFAPCRTTELGYDILHYLLSKMTPEQQMEIVEAQPEQVMCCFLYWPRQNLFLANADLIWPFIPRGGYYDLQIRMFHACDRNFFPKFFQDFFVRSPLSFQNFFVGLESDDFIPAFQYLTSFLSAEESECLEVMFRSFRAADRVKLVFHHRVLYDFYEKILKDKWHPVKVCLREAALSKEEKEILKDTFIAVVKARLRSFRFFPLPGRRKTNLRKNQKLKRLFDFLEGTDAAEESQKR